MIAVVRPNHLDLIQLEGPIANQRLALSGRNRSTQSNTQRTHSNPAAT